MNAKRAKLAKSIIEIAFEISGVQMPESLKFTVECSPENQHVFSGDAVEIATQRIYLNGLRKFWRKKLAHIKKPRERKRKMVDRYAFATAVYHKSKGKPTTK